MIGVLALQGGFVKHIQMLASLGVKTLEVRKTEDLKQCSGLIIPGGESTTIKHQINFSDMEAPLKEFIAQKPVFGTCAGLILLSDYNFLDLEIQRNGYGRQYESFSQTLEVKFPLKKKKDFQGIFIRAPRIKNHGSNVQILSTLNDEPVLIQKGSILGASFHPELSGDSTIHKYFVKKIAF